MSAVGAVFLVAVLLIVLALVYFLVSTILALRKINAGLDTVIANENPREGPAVPTGAASKERCATSSRFTAARAASTSSRALCFSAHSARWLDANP